jgi:putative ABC transport system permease protein
MKLTAKLAYSQLNRNRKRTVFTLLGIMLSVSMITAVYGFAFSGFAALENIAGTLRTEYYTVVVSVGIILSVVIFLSSVTVMSNAFRVSAGERLYQFGILKSVGATQKQITQTIVYEGLWLSYIGIPAGIILGLLVQLLGINIANILLADINVRQDNPLVFHFIFAWQAILLAVVVGFVTVIVSAWLPARKSAKISAINAIRKTGEIKIKNTRKKSGWLVSKVFGFEGVLAVKSLQRSKRNLRATVISLTVSIILFVSASSFGTHLNRMADVVIFPTDADVHGWFNAPIDYNLIFNEDGEITANDVVYIPVDNILAEQITERLRTFPNTTVMGIGDNRRSILFANIPLPLGMATERYQNYLDSEGIASSFTLVTTDAETYAQLARLAGVPLGSNILVNYIRVQINERWTEFVPFYFDYQTVSVLSGADVIEVPLHGVLSGDRVPREIYQRGWVNPVIIVPDLDSATYNWFAQTPDSTGFVSFMYDIFDEFLTLDGYFRSGNIGVINIAASQSEDRAIIRLVMVSIYGFVGMLTLLGLTNVISTISTNVRSRSREFAVLQSVGMTPKGLNRMINLESLLSSVKSLVIGIPVGIMVSYLLYHSMIQAVDFSFIFPFFPILQCFLAVFIITWVTMRYTASRLRGGSVVENIREN